MSFSIAASPTAETFEEDLRGTVDVYKETNSANLNPAADDLIEAGIAAAKAFTETFGEKVEQYSVTLSGHGNEGHGPADGYANEALTVSVNVTSYKTETPTSG